MNYAGDILEHALNFGVDSAAIRFNEPASKVEEIVLKFKAEISIVNGPCSCEIARMNGITMMCFMCERQEPSSRILI